MGTFTVSSTQVGTALVTGPGTITALAAVSQPAQGDVRTQLELLDATGIPSSHARTLYAADLTSLLFLLEPKPDPTLSPGLTAPTYPKSLGNISMPFSNGIYVKSCPANVQFSITTA
jgi:hypothetical protein